MSNDYYVYIYAYPDGCVFYVGKGRGSRINDHERDARNDVQSDKCIIIRSIWEQGGQVLKRKLYTNLSEQDALAIEAVLIALFDRANLANEQSGCTKNGLIKRKLSKSMSPKIIGYKHHTYQKDGLFFEDSIPIYEKLA